jgi:hypothetical protein
MSRLLELILKIDKRLDERVEQGLSRDKCKIEEILSPEEINKFSDEEILAVIVGYGLIVKSCAFCSQVQPNGTFMPAPEYMTNLPSPYKFILSHSYCGPCIKEHYSDLVD